MSEFYRNKKRSHWAGMVFCVVVAILALPLIATGAKPGGETEAGNNLSYPVIWAEGGYSGPTPPGTSGMVPVTDGVWWYWWGMEGADPNINPQSCLPDPDNDTLCDDGFNLQANGDPPGLGWVKAYVQKDPGNIWQAGSMDGTYNAITVDWIDWGDNLESVDWYTRSQVRTEVVLYEDFTDGDLEDIVPSLTEYEMRHVDGWGIDEVHGLAVNHNAAVLGGSGTQATVYSDCARLTIQKLLIDRDDPNLDLTWNNDDSMWTDNGESWGDQVNWPIFNMPVYEGGDGPGYYSSEINVKGKVIFGYTWNVRNLNDATENEGEVDGDYRITFSFDDASCPEDLNTFFRESTPEDIDGTQIMLPEEEEESGDETNNETGGGTAVIDFGNNLTYIDVRILERTGGGGGGGKKH